MAKFSHLLHNHLVILLLIFSPLVKTEELLESHREVLKILKSDNYSSNLIPPQFPCDKNTSFCTHQPLKIYINLGLRDIEAIDDKTMELKLQLSIRQKWKDPRLQYPTQDPHGYVTLNADTTQKPWTPDIFIGNEKYSSVHRITRPNSFIRIFPDGRIFQSTALALTTSCFMNLERLPFDKQACDIQISSYSYQNDTLQLHWDDQESLEQVTNIEGQRFTQFRLIGHKAGNCVGINLSGAYSTIFLRLEFQRQLPYYLSQVFIPCVMFNIITWVGFWLGDAMEARLSLTVTVLLTLATQILGTVQTLPQVSYNTGVGTFTGICLTFAAMSILETATVFFVMRGEDVGMKRWRTKNIANWMVNLREKKMAAVDTKKGDFVEEKLGDSEKNEESYGQATKIDNIAKILFPLAFSVFILAYFVYYVFIWEWAEPKEETGRVNDSNQLCSGWTMK